MADITLSVGFQFETDANSAISQLESMVKAHPIKMPIDLNTEAIQKNLTKLKAALTKIASSDIRVDGLQAALNSTTGLSTALRGAKAQTDAMASSSNKAAAAGKNLASSAKEEIITLSKLEQAYNKAQSAAIKANNGTKNYTAAMNGASKNDYAGLQTAVEQFRDIQTRYQTIREQMSSGTADSGQIKTLYNDMKMLNTSVREFDTNIRLAGENHKAQLQSEITSQETLISLYQKTSSYYAGLQKESKSWKSGKRGESLVDIENIKRELAAFEELEARYNALARNNFKPVSLGGGRGTDSVDRLVGDMTASSKHVSELYGNLKMAGNAAGSFRSKMMSLGGIVASLYSMRMVFTQIWMAMRKMVTSAIEVDSAMTELKKVTDETNSTYAKFMDTASTRAIKTGATIADTINATADFARLGYAIDDASKLADAAIVYKNVGDGIESIGDASESIISTMKAFNVEADNSMSIVDKYNEVGNNFAISSEGVGEAMKRSASSLAAANNSLDESIGLVTAANAVVQNPEKVGTTMKTVSMYLRAAKTEAEDAGITTDGMASSVSKLREELLALTNQKVDIMLDDDTFKSTFQIFDELHDVWDDLSDITQARITEMLGGKRNANVVSGLINNFDIAKEAMQTAADSAGSATAENEKFLQSIQGHINVLKASFEDFSRTLLTRDVVNSVLDIATGFIKSATSVANLIQHLGGLKTLLSGIAAIVMLINRNTIANKLEKMFSLNLLSKVENKFNAIGDAANKIFSGGSIKSLLGSLSKGKLLTAGLTAALAVATAIYGVVSAIKQKHYENIKAEQEQIDNAVESGRTATQNVKTVSELVNQYRSLTSLKSDNSTFSLELESSKMEEARSIQEQLTSLVGAQAGNLDLVNGKIGQQKALLSDILQAQTEASKAQIDAAYYSSKKDYETGFEWTDDNKPTAKAARQVSKTLRDANYVVVGLGEKYKELWSYDRLRKSNVKENYEKELDALDGYDAMLDKLTKDKALLDVAMTTKAFAEGTENAENAASAYSMISQYMEEVSEKKKAYDEALQNKAISDALDPKYVFKDQKAFDKFVKKRLKDTSQPFEYNKALIEQVANNNADFVLSDDVKKKLVTNYNEFFDDIIDNIDPSGELNEKSKDIKKSFLDGMYKVMDSDEWGDFVSWFDRQTAKGVKFKNFHDISKAYREELQSIVDATKNLNTAKKAYEDFQNTLGKYDKQTISAKEKYDDLQADNIRRNFDDIWANSDFQDAKNLLIERFKANKKLTGAEVDGVITELSDKHQELAQAIANTGVSADYLAKIFESYAAGKGGVDVLTGGVLALDRALNGPTDKFAQMETALNQWSSAMSSPDYDNNFKTYTDAYDTLMKEIKAGTTGSKAFEASAELLFGEDLLNSWEWNIDTIKKKANEHKALWTQIDDDAKEGGKNYTAQIKDTLNKLAKDGQILDDDNNVLAKISGTGDDWEISDIDWSNIGELAEMLEIDTGAAQALLQALQMTGSVDFSNLEQATQAVKEMSEIQAARGENTFFNEDSLTETMLALGASRETIAKVKQELTSSDEHTFLVSVSDDATTLADNMLKAEVATGKVGEKIDISSDAFLEFAKDMGWSSKDAGKAIDTLTDQTTGLSNITFDGTEEGLTNLKDRLGELDGEHNISLDISNSAEEAVEQLERLNQLIEALLEHEGIDIPVNIDMDDPDLNTDMIESGIESVNWQIQGLTGQKYTVDIDSDVSGVSKGVDLANEETKSGLVGGTTKIVSDTSDALSGIIAVNNEEVGDKTTTINAVDNASSVISSVKGQINAIPSVKNVTISVSTSGVSAAVDAIKRAASAGGAKAGGTNSAPRGRTLVGELGPELVRDDDMYYLVGQNGPEFVNMRGGEQIFTAEETKKIYRRNGAKNKSGRAYANGIRSYHENRSYSPADNGFDKKEKDNDDKSKSWFEQQYELHSHLVKMNAETDEAYLNWLNGAYKQAYNECLISLEDFHKYQEEVYSGLQDLFEEYLDDMEHDISVREHFDHESQTILKSYQTMISEVEKEIASARLQGLKDTDDYVQKLQDKWIDYTEAVKELREDVKDEAKDAFEELIEFRIDMIEKETDKSKDELDKRLDALTEFYDKQREMLEDQRDEEDYLKEQAEKRKAVADIEKKLEQISLDNSAWANKRRIELQQDLMDAREELEEFERDHAYDLAIDNLDKMEEAQKAELDKETEALEKQYETQKALRMAAVQDIKNGNKELYEEMIEWNNKYGSGIEEDITEMWERAYVAAQKYNESFNKPYAIDTIDLNIGGKTMSFPINAGISNVTGYKDPMGTYNNSPIAAPKQTAKPAAQAAAQKSAPPSLNKGSYVSVKPGTRWYADSYGGGSSGTARAGTIKYVNLSGSHPYNIEGLGWVRKQDIVGYATGTRKAAAGLHSINEKGEEYIFTSPSNGTQYKMFSGGEKVLNARATEFLYDFANTGGKVLAEMVKSAIATAETNPLASVMNNSINLGDIIVNGSADNKTVSEIRRAQRQNLDFVLRELNKLQKT